MMTLVFTCRNYATKVRNLSQSVSQMSLFSNSSFSAPVVESHGGESTVVVDTDVDMENSARAAQPAAQSASTSTSTAPLAANEDTVELVDLDSDDDFGDRMEVLDPSVASLLAHRKRTLLQLCSSPDSTSSLISTSPPCVLLSLVLNARLFCYSDLLIVFNWCLLYSSSNSCRALVLWSSPSAFSASPETGSSSSLESESEERQQRQQQHARPTARRAQHHSRRARARLSCDASGSEHVEPPEAQKALSSRATGQLLEKLSRDHSHSTYASALPNLNPRLRPATVGNSYERMEQ